MIQEIHSSSEFLVVFVNFNHFKVVAEMELLKLN